MDKTLICYFSASGITRSVANKIKNLITADTYEIVPVRGYTDSDLDWTNKESRSSVEMQDVKARPEILSKIDNLDNYHRILLGFPVWWDVAPRIINTFIEANDLTNKTVYVFVTSGSSSYENSLDDLRKTYPNINFVSGIRLSLNTPDDDIINWLK